MAGGGFLTIRGSVRLGAQRMAELSGNLYPALAAGANLAAKDMIVRLHDAAPVGTSQQHLRDSFKLRPAIPGAAGGALRAKVVTTQPVKLLYVTRGTGLYGPAHAPITPRVKRALFWPGADHPVASVAGQRPNPFVERLLPELPELLERRMRDAVDALMRRQLARLGLNATLGDLFGGAAGRGGLG